MQLGSSINPSIRSAIANAVFTGLYPLRQRRDRHDFDRGRGWIMGIHELDETRSI
jgi:hypothetical protein